MRTFVLDSQILKAIQRCGIYTHMKFDMNLALPEKPKALERGTLVHNFFAHYYGKRKESDNKADWLTCANYAFELTKPFSTTLQLDQEDINIVIRSLEQYYELHRYEPLEVLVVEAPFAMTLYESEEDNLRIVYVGVTDLIAKLENEPNEKVYDHKSQSRKSDYILLDDQFEGYALATKSNILWVNVIGLQTSVEPKDKFRREPLSYPQPLLDRWVSHVVFWVKQWLVWSEDKNYPENHQGCNAWGQKCEFLEICTSITPEARAWKIQSAYVVNEPWDPTSALGKRD